MFFARKYCIVVKRIEGFHVDKSGEVPSLICCNNVQISRLVTNEGNVVQRRRALAMVTSSFTFSQAVALTNCLDVPLKERNDPSIRS